MMPESLESRLSKRQDPRSAHSGHSAESTQIATHEPGKRDLIFTLGDFRRQFEIPAIRIRNCHLLRRPALSLEQPREQSILRLAALFEFLPSPGIGE